MKNSYNIGKTGENQAADFLKLKGYTILEKNYRANHGEIDIIAIKNNTLVFVEVKTRASSSKIRGILAVDKNKQSRIIGAAINYIYTKKISANYRFDIIEITNINGRQEIKHIIDAFRPSENLYI